MTREDADIVRRAYEVWNRSGPAAVTEQFWAEDAIYREHLGRGPGPTRPRAGIYRGRDAALTRMRGLLDFVGALKVDLDDLIEVEDGRIVACVRLLGESPSDAPYTQSFAVVHRLRDGLIVEADYYLDRAQALQAVGVRE